MSHHTQPSPQMRSAPLPRLANNFEENLAFFARNRRQLVQHTADRDHISDDDPTWHPSFEPAVELLAQLGRSMSNILTTDDHEEVYDNLRERLVIAKGGIPECPPVHIAIVGRIGEGKSFLVGALLDDMAVVKEGSPGESVTKVVLEYVYFAGEDSSRYNASVETFTWEEMDARLKENLRHLEFDFFSNYDDDDDDDDDDDNESLSESADAEFLVAKDVIMAILRGHTGFEDEDCLEKYFAVKSGPEQFEKKCNDFLGIAKTRYDQLQAHLVPLQSRTFESTEELWKCIEPYTNKDSEVAEPGHDPWPFVKLVQIGGKFPLLKQGTTIADTPGLEDVDGLSSDLAMAYITRRQCSGVMVACKTARAKADKTATKCLRKVRDIMGRYDRVMLVCTMSEDATLSDKDCNYSDRAENFKLTAKKALVQQKLKAVENAQDSPNALQDQMELEFQQSLIELEITKLNVSVRNRSIKEFFSSEKFKDLDVFCVSAMDYNRNVCGYRIRDKLPMDPDLTGMPRLKRRIAGIASKIRQNTVNEYVMDSIPTLLGSLELACPASKISIHLKLPTRVSQLEKCKTIVDAGFKSYQQEQIKPMLEKLEHGMDGFREHAETLCDSWIATNDVKHNPRKRLRARYEQKPSPWGPRQFLAFLRHHGNHQLPGRSHCSWNKDLLKPLSVLLGQLFVEITSQVSMFLQIESRIIDLFKDIEETVNRQAADSSAGTLDPFMKQMKQRQDQVKKIIRDLQKNLVRVLLEQQGFCCVDTGGYYFRTSMDRIYDKCLQDKPQDGQSVFKYKQSLLKGYLNPYCPFSPYKIVHERLAGALLETMGKERRSTYNKLKTTLRQMFGDIESLKQTHKRTAEKILEQTERIERAKKGLEDVKERLRECGMSVGEV